MSLGRLLREQAEVAGDRPLFRFDGTTTTVAEVESRTNRLANVLRAHGIARGDRVAVMLPNGVGFPVAWLAIAKLGAVMVPVNVGYRSADLAHVIKDSGATLALTGAHDTAIALRDSGIVQVGALDPADAGSLALPGTFDAGAELAAADDGFDLVDGDLVNLQYTSGTTGFPKGCMLTHDYWLGLAEHARDWIGARENDVDLTAQPFSYMDPQWNTVLCLKAGIPLVILPRFSASTFWRSVRDEGVTFFYLLGTMPVYLLRQPPDPLDWDHRVRIVMCSGIVPDLHRTLEDRWGVPWREAYGSTETGFDLAVPIDDDTCVGSGAVGSPVEGKRAKLVDGELAISGAPMMQGYWNAPEATASKVRDGWLYTGDLARQDDRGYFHLVGRSKDMVRRSGENIAAAEVEAVLAQHPDVHAAAVVPVPDELRGEEVKAFVQLARPVPAKDLIAFVRERLAPFKVPRFVQYVDSFPMTPSERIAKHMLPTGRDDEYDGTKDTP
ncbi:AMP-binding protein [Actinocrispum wychmicini]|uniref:Crotonobetaine/carnitine-CoA ligase n=1 Tax=Actinocrispum wychmicini TaxID=1213861 RepID=A0A4R2ITA0_9PSEU|nr:AMP-binding protein [Actinocrispum wychmicini]TCO47368.1 crotonobetaine/carnitine-CoA ligase [Actinocrispum wychmicini]